MSERQKLKQLLDESFPEQEIDGAAWFTLSTALSSTLVVIQGFEERSLGALRCLVKKSFVFEKVIVVRYSTWHSTEEVFRLELEELSSQVSAGPVEFFELREDVGLSTFPSIATDCVYIDISATNSCLLFMLMDSLAKCRKHIGILYSEAQQYWPTKNDWESALRVQQTQSNITEWAENSEWMFGGANKVHVIEGHGGFDHPVRCRRLLAFLSYKYSRTAAIINEGDYNQILPVIGTPRSSENNWREDVLKQINFQIIARWGLNNLPTFGYLDTLKYLVKEGFEGSPPFLLDGNLDISPLGSKLQSLAVWMFACVIKSCSVVTSLPEKYYKQHFSSGVGKTFVFKVRSPFYP